LRSFVKVKQLSIFSDKILIILFTDSIINKFIINRL
jgi:hypothetical protein